MIFPDSDIYLIKLYLIITLLMVTTPHSGDSQSFMNEETTKKLKIRKNINPEYYR